MGDASSSLDNEKDRLATLSVHLQEFQSTMDALQGFLDVAPHVHDLDQQPSILDVIRQYGQTLGRLQGEWHEEVLNDIVRFKYGIGGGQEMFEDELIESDEEPSNSPYSKPDYGHRTIIAATQAGIQPRLPLLLRSTIPMAVGAFEVLVGHLLAAFYHVRSGLISKDEKEFSLADLEQFTTVQEAFNDAVQRRIDKVLSGGLEEWTKWFSRKGIEINVSKLALDWPETLELFQRRHVIVHNAAKVSKRYLAKLTGKVEKLPSLGSEIITDANYVQNTLDNLNVLGYLLTAFVQKSLVPGKDQIGMADLLEGRADNLITRERWRAARKLCLISKSLKEFSERTRLAFQCEEWLCTKKLDGMDIIRREVEGWDATALGHRFQAMRYALLDMNDEAEAALVKALGSGEVVRLDVFLSPLLRGIQESLVFKRNYYG